VVTCRAPFPICLPTAPRAFAVGMANLPYRLITRPSCAMAALHLIEHPNTKSRQSPEVRAGAGFPNRRRDRR